MEMEEPIDLKSLSTALVKAIAALQSALAIVDCAAGKQSMDGRVRAKGGFDLLSPSEASAYSGYAESTLAKLRSYGDGPRYLKPSHKKILYRRADLDEWTNRTERGSTAENLPHHSRKPDGKHV
jgi:hypothetical protein